MNGQTDVVMDQLTDRPIVSNNELNNDNENVCIIWCPEMVVLLCA